MTQLSKLERFAQDYSQLGSTHERIILKATDYHELQSELNEAFNKQEKPLTGGMRLSGNDDAFSITLYGVCLLVEREKFREINKNMDFKERLVKEKEELDEKLEKLRDFIAGNMQYILLPKPQQFLLTEQVFAMSSYSRILAASLELLEA